VDSLDDVAIDVLAGGRLARKPAISHSGKAA
jgi:hypothetical protein